MVESAVERRLAAILAADVVGYSKLMGKDEAGTLVALKKLRTDLVDPRIGEHKGRVFKATGDGLLVEFPSVVNAVACAVDIQRAMAARNADLGHSAGDGGAECRPARRLPYQVPDRGQFGRCDHRG